MIKQNNYEFTSKDGRHTVKLHLEENSEIWELSHVTSAENLFLIDLYCLIKDIFLEEKEIKKIRTAVKNKNMVFSRDTTLEEYCETIVHFWTVV